MLHIFCALRYHDLNISFAKAIFQKYHQPINLQSPDIRGDHEGLFELAICTIKNIFLLGYLQQCNRICFVGLFDRYLTLR
jgi:hypothetical protein